MKESWLKIPNIYVKVSWTHIFAAIPACILYQKYLEETWLESFYTATKVVA